MHSVETTRRWTNAVVDRAAGGGRQFPLVWMALAATCAVGTATFAYPPVSARADAGINFVGRLEYGPVPTTSESPDTLVDPVLHRAYLTPFVFSNSRVRILDLTSLRQVADVQTPTAVDGEGVDANATGVIDVMHHRIFYNPDFNVGGAEVCPPGGGAGTGAPQYGVYVLDEVSLKWKELQLPCLQDGNPFAIQGMEYDTATNKLLMDGVDDYVPLYAGFADAANANRTYVRQVDAETGAVDWEVSVSSACSQLIDGQSAPEGTSKLMRVGNAVAFTCQRFVPPATTENFLARIPLDASGRPQTDASGTPIVQSTPLLGGDVGFRFDEPSGRLLLYSNSPGNGLGAFVFDVQRNVFDGFIGTGGSTSAYALRGVGLDPTSGRLYMETGQGLIVADIRHDPLPAGELYALPQLAQPGNQFWMIGVDQGSHRVFIPDQNPKTQSFLAFSDGVAPTIDQSRVDPDNATSDVAEAPGTTGVNLSGSGNAFGLYYLSAGGVQHTEENADPLCYIGMSPEKALLGQCLAEAGVSHGDRVQFYGHVAELALSNIGAGAITAPIDVTDSATAKDFEQARVYDYNCTTDSEGNQHCQSGLKTILESSGITWPADRAACQDFGGKPHDSSVRSVGGSAGTSCDLNRETVTGESTANDTAVVPAGIPPVAYQSNVKAYRDPEAGLVTVATASATGLTIPLPTGANLTVGQISAEAKTVAHGRPGSASATYSRHIADFSSPAYSCSSTCDPQQVIDAINQAFGTAGVLAVASLPQPETEDHTMGTPRGYQALVTKNQAVQTSDETVNDDFSDTVAGLEIVYFEDGKTGRSRQIFQFAGVHAESHYGIYRLGAEGTTTDLTPPPTDQPLPISGVSLPSSTAGTSHETAQTGGQQQSKNPLQRILSYITDQIADTWRLFVSDPKRAAALAIVWGLLLAPLYLGARRRSLRRRLEAMA